MRTTQRLLVGQEYVFVQPPVQEGSYAVYILDFEDGEFIGLRIGLLQCGDGTVLAIHVDEHVQDFAFFQGEFVPVSGEEHPATRFQLQVVALGHDAFNAGAIVFADFHNSVKI